MPSHDDSRPPPQISNNPPPKTADENLDWWEKPERSIRFLKLLHALCWVNPDGAIFPPGKARELDPTGTMSFSRGNASGISDFTIHSR